MAARSKGRPSKRGQPAKPSKALIPPIDKNVSAVPEPDTKVEQAEEHFVRGVVTRGEAARSVDGLLPPGATHEIVTEKEGELPTIRRKRFSMF